MSPTLLAYAHSLHNEAALKDAPVGFKQTACRERALPVECHSRGSCPSLVANSLRTGSGHHLRSASSPVPIWTTYTLHLF